MRLLVKPIYVDVLLIYQLLTVLARFVPMDKELPANELQNLLEQSKAAVVISQEIALIWKAPYTRNPNRVEYLDMHG